VVGGSGGLAGSAQTLEWDAEGRLAKVTEAGRTTTHVYDANGSRLLRRDPDGTTLYLGPMELRLDKASGQVAGTRYYSHGGAPVAVRSAQGVTWVATDHHGTNQLAVNAATPAVQRRRLTPFGAPRGQAPASWPDEKGFVGGTIDKATGLTHLGAREYDPGIGRFISVDPVIDPGDPQQLHGFAYANNSPVTFTDPDGLRTCLEACGSPEDNDMMNRIRASRASSTAGGSGAGNAPPAPPDNHKKRAQEIKKKSMLDIVVEAGGEMLLEFLGVNDIVNCVSKGSVGACVSTILGLLPWGKVLKAGKAIAKGVYRVVKGYLHWHDELKWADDVLKRADEAAQAAAKPADDVAAGAGKGADDVAAGAGKGADDVAAGAGKPADEVAGGAGKPADDARGGGDAPSKPSRPTCANSFVPGTLVRMADGSDKPIEQLQVGDRVLATDTGSGRTEARTVVETILGQGDKNLVELTVDVDGPRGDATGVIVATAAHPR
jgi:RHS repeat-associated protein